jgi:hypothetical protein
MLKASVCNSLNISNYKYYNGNYYTKDYRYDSIGSLIKGLKCMGMSDISCINMIYEICAHVPTGYVIYRYEPSRGEYVVRRFDPCTAYHAKKLGKYPTYLTRAEMFDKSCYVYDNGRIWIDLK